jgi:hypothetical protein
MESFVGVRLARCKAARLHSSFMQKRWVSSGAAARDAREEATPAGFELRNADV